MPMFLVQVGITLQASTDSTHSKHFVLRAASSGRQASASQTNSAQATSRSSATGTATAAPTAAVPASSTAAAGADTSHHAAGVTAGAPDAPAAAAISHGAAAIDPAAADSSAVPAASSAPQGSSEQAQPQSGAGQSQGTIGAARESASGSRGADGSRRRRGRRPAISPVVTMALGSLLQTTLEGEAFQDPVNVLGNAAQLLATAHTFDGQNRAQILVSEETQIEVTYLCAVELSCCIATTLTFCAEYTARTIAQAYPFLPKLFTRGSPPCNLLHVYSVCQVARVPPAASLSHPLPEFCIPVVQKYPQRCIDM